MGIFLKVYQIYVNTLLASISVIVLSVQIIINKVNVKEIITQIKTVGVNSTVVIITSGIFIGLVLSLQGYYTLNLVLIHC